MRTAEVDTREYKIGNIGKEIVNGVPLYGTAKPAWIFLRLPQRKDRKRKHPHPSVSDAGSMAASETVSHTEEQISNRNRGNDISISPRGTRRKGKLTQIVRN